MVFEAGTIGDRDRRRPGQAHNGNVEIGFDDTATIIKSIDTQVLIDAGDDINSGTTRRSTRLT